ncbi:hypothetical protein ES703_76936 [subsurface metagenome]
MDGTDSALELKRSAKYLLVVSLDGLSSADFGTIKELPHFKELLQSGALVREVKGVYPTQTYPLHASIITGTYPQKHGIVANTLNQPGLENPEWFWFRKAIKARPLYDIARSAGLKVASLLWPTTGGAALDYNLPEIPPTRPGQNLLWSVFRYGTPLFLLDILVRFGWQLRGIERFYLDNFTSSSAAYLIRTGKCNLLLLHLLDLDAARHKHGFLSKKAEQVLQDQDRRLGKLLKASRQAGTYEETAFIVLGDHAYIDVHHRININTALRKAGFLRFNRRGRLADWKAWGNSCGGSSQIYLRDREDRTLRQSVNNALLALKQDPDAGIKAVFDRKQIVKMKLGQGIDFMLEAEPGFYFNGKFGEKVVEAAPGDRKAVHGYLPHLKGYSSLLLASGAGVKKGADLQEINIVDIGPTLAALLGLAMPSAEGRVVTEILAKDA